MCIDIADEDIEMRGSDYQKEEKNHATDEKHYLVLMEQMRQQYQSQDSPQNQHRNERAGSIEACSQPVLVTARYDHDDEVEADPSDRTNVPLYETEEVIAWWQMVLLHIC